MHGELDNLGYHKLKIKTVIQNAAPHIILS